MTKAPLTTQERATMVVLKAQGKSFSQIAKEVGRSDKTVAAALRKPDASAQVDAVRDSLIERLHKYGIEHTNVEDFKQDRAEIFAGLQEKVVMSFTEEDLKKASVRDRVIVLGTLYDKERLERGQSTSNQSVFFRIVEESDRAEQ